MEDAKFSQLRIEIVESQKIQANYLKWKLISVATLVSIAIGTSGKNTNGEAEFLLCAVPFCCAYIDILSLHAMMRVLTIGAFFKSEGCAYENFVENIRKNSKSSLKFENYALNGSSVIFNAIPILYGIYKLVAYNDLHLGIALIAFGITGGLTTLLLVKRFNLSVKQLEIVNKK